ncbi:hypothetical protein FA13DRAFT_1794576 [Coprinellus micaceus]|uniref:Uncharacterized protein n=1 Tax=Coprinellus micaceus TaxID=71717 RepID=A0A4Y7T284_COPMI|nr:hypothetical protein FA13DRAFT_1794576 [Coprinellus micaceus]
MASNLHAGMLESHPLSSATSTPISSGFAIPDSSQRVDGSLSASQGIASLFTPDQIKYFESFTEQVRGSDKDGRRQLVAFVANETLKALDGESTSIFTQANRSAFLKNVREWFRTRVRKRKQEYGYGHCWKGREVFYRLNVSDVMSQYRRMISALPGGKPQAIAKAVPVDAEGLQTAAADDDGEEEDDDMDVSTPMNVRVVQISVFQKALSDLWNSLQPEERDRYQSTAQKWRLQGPTEGEKRRLADKDMGSITAAFQTDLFVQMGALCVTTIAWVNANGEMEIACLEGHPRLIGRSFKKECLGTVIPGFIKAFGTWAHPILINPAPTGPADPSQPQMSLDLKGKRRFVWPMDRRGVPILSQAADLVRVGEQAWVILPAAARSYIGQCYDTGDRRGASLPPPYTYMATNIRNFLSEQSLPDEFVKAFTGIGDAGVPALTSLIDYWHGLQQRGIDPLVFKVFVVGTGERKCLRRSIPREVFRASDLDERRADLNGSRLENRTESTISEPGPTAARKRPESLASRRPQEFSPRTARFSSRDFPYETETQGRVSGNATPAQIHSSPAVWPRVGLSHPVGPSRGQGNSNYPTPDPSGSSSQFGHPVASTHQTPYPQASRAFAGAPGIGALVDTLPGDFMEEGTPIGDIVSHDEGAMATDTDPPALIPDGAQVLTPLTGPENPFFVQPVLMPSQGRPLPVAVHAPVSSSSMDIQATSLPHPPFATQIPPPVIPSGNGGRRTELQILQEDTRQRFGDVTSRRVRRVRVRDG